MSVLVPQEGQADDVTWLEVAVGMAFVILALLDIALGVLVVAHLVKGEIDTPTEWLLVAACGVTGSVGLAKTWLVKRGLIS